MNDDNTSGPTEIVIVRRRGGDDGAAAKGGAWKIAYADFVTAMMAFFLVMWLINASNEATRAQVASYFNPIKLTDNTTGKKGLKEAKDNTEQSKEESSGAGGTPPAPSDVKHQSEIMSNPDKVLEKIEAKAKAQAAAAAEAAPAAASGETAPADPFEPPQNGAAVQPADSVEPPSPGTATPAQEAPSSFSTENLEPVLPDAVPTSPISRPKPEQEQEQEPVSQEEPKKQEEPQPASEVKQGEAPQNAEPADPKVEEAKKAAEAAKAQEILEAQQIADEIAKKLGTGLDKLPESVEVKRTDDGILISLTDRENFGMFLNGSAEPVPELVSLIGAIAGVLKDRDGYIVVRGHTDSKPYRIKTYDNWQLSTDRAHFAQYMLVRAGLDGSRVRRIEGVADREPRNPNDPQAPENRRIEILLGRDTKT